MGITGGSSVPAISPKAVVGAGLVSALAGGTAPTSVAVAVGVGEAVAVGAAVALAVGGAVALAVGDGVRLGSGVSVGGGAVSVGSGGTNTGVGVGSGPPQAVSRRNRMGR